MQQDFSCLFNVKKGDVLSDEQKDVLQDLKKYAHNIVGGKEEPDEDFDIADIYTYANLADWGYVKEKKVQIDIMFKYVLVDVLNEWGVYYLYENFPNTLKYAEEDFDKMPAYLLMEFYNVYSEEIHDYEKAFKCVSLGAHSFPRACGGGALVSALMEIDQCVYQTGWL